MCAIKNEYPLHFGDCQKTEIFERAFLDNHDSHSRPVTQPSLLAGPTLMGLSSAKVWMLQEPSAGWKTALTHQVVLKHAAQQSSLVLIPLANT